MTYGTMSLLESPLEKQLIVKQPWHLLPARTVKLPVKLLIAAVYPLNALSPVWGADNRALSPNYPRTRRNEDICTDFIIHPTRGSCQGYSIDIFDGYHSILVA